MEVGVSLNATPPLPPRQLTPARPPHAYLENRRLGIGRAEQSMRGKAANAPLGTETAEDKKRRKARGLSASEGAVISDVVELQPASRSTQLSLENPAPSAKPAAAARRGSRGKSLKSPLPVYPSQRSLENPTNILSSATHLLPSSPPCGRRAAKRARSRGGSVIDLKPQEAARHGAQQFAVYHRDRVVSEAGDRVRNHIKRSNRAPAGAEGVRTFHRVG